MSGALSGAAKMESAATTPGPQPRIAVIIKL